MEKTLSPAARGIRFAPSPTGRLHVGNLRTAWVSHLIAQSWGEPWVVRFEDIDAPRSVPGAREEQLADMAALRLIPDRILIQSEARERHWRTFQRAIHEKRVYPCTCSRKEVREALERSGSAPHPTASPAPRSTAPPATPGAAAPTYSGHCRAARSGDGYGLPSLAWRFAVAEDASGRSDFIVGRSAIELDALGLPANPDSFAPAYHWACAVDDLDGGYRLLVRAADLAEVLPQHRAIMTWLALSEGRVPQMPAVFHTSLITQNDGHRLEKRTQGATLTELAQAGFGIDRILERFNQSWDADCLRLLQAGAGEFFGEKKHTMTLKELGLG